MQNKSLPKAVVSGLRSFGEETLKQTAKGTGSEAQKFAEGALDQLTGITSQEQKAPESVEDIAAQTEDLSVAGNAQRRIDQKDQSRVNQELGQIKQNPNKLHQQYLQSVINPQTLDNNEQQRLEEQKAEEQAKIEKAEEKKRRFLAPIQVPKGIRRGLMGVKQAMTKGERKDNKRAAA